MITERKKKVKINLIPGIVDVSKWNTNLDWNTAVQNGLFAVIQKFTQGLSYDDNTAIQHMYDAYSAGVRCLGAYHFGDASNPSQQARHFIRSVKADFPDGLNNVFLMLDLELNGSNTMTIREAEEFVQVVNDEVGHYPVLYMGEFGPSGNAQGLPSIILSKCDLMLPAYGPHENDLDRHLPRGFKIPTNDTDTGGYERLWQYTDGTHHGHEFPGLGKVDQSYAVGFSSVDAVKNWWWHVMP
jgi:GH25 family lysozyme M1 (1,4-beta-N-acetylmuramidase)